MSTQRSAGWQRVHYTREGYAYCKNGCGTVCSHNKQALYCSAACRHEYSLRNFPAYARAEVWNRDRGVCALCGVATEELAKRWSRMLHSGNTATYQQYLAEAREYGAGPGQAHQSLWEMDHIVPVVEGGGQCGLDNLRTLCFPCHRRVTRELRRRLADARRSSSPPSAITLPLPLEALSG